MAIESAPDCAARSNETGRLLESLGHHVKIVDLPALDEPVDGAFGTVMTVAVARDLERWRERTGETITADDVEPGNLFLAQMGAQVTGALTRGRSRRCSVVTGRRGLVGRPRRARHAHESGAARSARRAGAGERRPDR